MRALLFRGLVALSGRFSLSAVQRFAQWLAPWVWHVSRRHRYVIEANVRACFPELEESEQQRLARESLAETLKTVFELGPLWRRHGNQVDAVIVDVDGWQEVQKAAQSGQGVIIAAPHLGNWEVLGLFLSRLPDFSLLYKSPSSPGIEKSLLHYRGQAGARQVAATPTGVRQLLKALKSGGVVGILPDQKPKAGQGEFAPFFGQPAYTMTLLSRLAARTGAPVFASAAIRRPDGRGFDLHFLRCGNDIHGPVARSVACLNAAMESLVRLAPAQYQWSYKRFSITPPGRRSIYRR